MKLFPDYIYGFVFIHRREEASKLLLQKISCKKYTFVCMCESHLSIKKKGRSIFYLLLSFYEITKGLSLPFFSLSLSLSLSLLLCLFMIFYLQKTILLLFCFNIYIPSSACDIKKYQSEGLSILVLSFIGKNAVIYLQFLPSLCQFSYSTLFFFLFLFPKY